jgi:hypothetical protein
LQTQGRFISSFPEIGFGIITYDANSGSPSTGSWPAATVSDTSAGTWGDVVYVPEFPTIAIPIAVCVIIPFIAFSARRRGRHE